MVDSYQLITTDSPTQTDLVRSILKDNGIESFAQTDALSEGLEALEGSSPYGSHIYVAAQNYERAKALIDAYFDKDYEQPGVEKPKD